MRIEFRLATADDVPAINQVERAAAELFRESAHPHVANGSVATTEELDSALRDASVWVATHEGRVRAFVWAQAIGNDAYVAELDVHPHLHRRGIGARLLVIVEEWARHRRLGAMTLTTFRGVPWNAPYYERLGFGILAADALPPYLREKLAGQAQRGFTDRVAMEKPLR